MIVSSKTLPAKIYENLVYGNTVADPHDKRNVGRTVVLVVLVVSLFCSGSDGKNRLSRLQPSIEQVSAQRTITLEQK